MGELLNNLDWTSIGVVGIPLSLAFLLQVLMDFSIAPYLVRWFRWVPVRKLFRANPVSLSGRWAMEWATDSPRFEAPTDRHDHPDLWQLGAYCSAHFISQGKRYRLFGRIRGSYVVGEWYDRKDPFGYFGTFQLRIVNNGTLEGQYVGHSQDDGAVKAGAWTWKKVL